MYLDYTNGGFEMSVQKYVVSHEEIGFTILKNHVLQNFTDVEALGLWVYLASLPPNWAFYKEQLKDHFKIGRERLNRLLQTLAIHNLIRIENTRDTKGRFVHMSLIVCNGNEFIIDAQPLKPAETLDEKAICAPLTENPLTANQSLDTDNYKDIYKKKEDKKKEDINNISATDVTHESEPCAFDEFWDRYPVKKNKIRAKKIWERKKLNKIAVLICNDVSNRQVNDSSWSNEQYIPHPSTYLQNELWNDAFVKASSNKHEHPVTASIREFKKTYQSKEFQALLN